MSAIRAKGNKSTELMFRLALVRSRIKGWVMHPRNIIGNPDFFFPKIKLAIFIDGCFWHGCPKHGHIPKTNTEYWREKIAGNKRRDKSSVRKLRYRDYTVIRFWEHELKKDTDKCIDKIIRSLNIEE